MIPKTIHYCWFGGKPLPEKVKRYMSSWRKVMPDAEIIRWDESNYDVNVIPYTAAAARERRWAFVTDYARLDIVFRRGGIYLDVDVELVKPLDPLLANRAFCGTEDGELIATGLILAAEPENELIGGMRDAYLNYRFLDANGRFTSPPCPVLQTEYLHSRGFRMSPDGGCFLGLMVYPSRYFAPIHPRSRKCTMTVDTYSIHHYLGSWYTPKKRIFAAVRNVLLLLFGARFTDVMRTLKGKFGLGNVGI